MVRQPCIAAAHSRLDATARTCPGSGLASLGRSPPPIRCLVPVRAVDAPRQCWTVTIRRREYSHLHDVYSHFYPMAQRTIIVGLLRPVFLNVRAVTVERTGLARLHAVVARVQQPVDVGSENATNADNYSRQAASPIERPGNMVQGRFHTCKLRLKLSGGSSLDHGARRGFPGR